ncbi:MAG: 6-phospho-beta-glucosidase [Ancrocorticia sp.]|uniref:6-phospho-beta-glucosidase n=1 Tax=Ancrocorticia sp. TaxID=2593684 RepID=UPI003F91FDC2
MKLTIVGGGGFRVPQIVEALSHRPGDQLDVSELCLFDTSAERLRVMIHVLDQLPIVRKPRITATADLTEAVTGADFVFSAIRVAGTEGRVRDELIPLSHGIIGQETVGPGGYAYAMRTIPAALDLAHLVSERAPNAWVINFTNPAGIITQAMRQILGKRVIGICDTPIGLVRRAARTLGHREAELDYDYIGLNHLGWLRSVTASGKELLPRLLDTPELLSQMEEARLIGPQWVRALGMIPNEYLFYYYRNREAVAQIAAEEKTRGQFLSDQQNAFYRAALAEPTRAAELWDAAHREREETYMAEAREVAGDGAREEDDLEGGYQEVALDLMAALSGGPSARMILGVSNTEASTGSGRRIIPALPDDAIIEVPCCVDTDGPVPAPVAPLDGAELGLVTQVKACETMVIDAVTTKNRELAWKAIALHPLVDSASAARQILDEYCEAIAEVAAVFE